MADLFGTKGLGGFAYYDRMPDLGRPTSADSDQSNIAAPFVVVFDKRGVRSIANVGTDMEENQQGISPQMKMSKSKSDIHYFFIFLRPTQARKAEQLWLDAEYCDLYDYLKEIALTEEGAFGGEEGEEYPLQGSIKHKSWKHNVGAWFVEKDIRATEAVMQIHCEPEEEEEPEKPSLGSLNWVSFSSENKVQGRIGLFGHEFLVWGARDGRSRVLGYPMEDWIWDEGEFEDKEEYMEFIRQVEQFGAYSLHHEIWDDETEEWEYIDSITGIVPSVDYDLIQAAHEFFDLKNPILLGGMNWISLRAEDFPEDEIGLLNWRWDGWNRLDDEDDWLQMWEDWDWDDDGFEKTHTPTPAAAAAAETFQAYTIGDTYTADEVYEIASSSQMRGPQSWDYQHYENPEDDRLLGSILRTPEWEIIRFDERVLREKPITHADCWIGTFYWPKPIRSNTPIVIQDGTVVDGNHRLASALTWGQSVLAFVPKGEEWWIEWFDEDEMKDWNDELDELLGSRTQSGVNSKYSSRSGADVEEFSVPFIDISNQDADGVPTEEIICVDHLYHGQYSMGGEEITAHSPYWSPNLDFALGHALFGAELEKMVPATRCEYCYEGCDKCEEGWVLLNRETDDIIPQTMPMVLQLNFDTEEEICFAQDIEHEKGQSYVLYGESSGWEIVPSNQLIPILERWLEDEEIPEDILFDTGAGYVSDDRIVWNRVEQAIQQLQN